MSHNIFSNIQDKSKNYRITVIGLFTLAFFARLTAVVLTLWHGLFVRWEYEQIANNILNGLGYRFEHLGVIHHAFGPPLYPFFTAFIYSITNHSQEALVVIQALLSAVTCILIFKIGLKVFDYKTGILASLFTALHPAIIIYATKLHPVTIDILLITLTFYVFLKAKDSLSLKDFLLLGVLFGSCLFSRTTIFFFLPFSFVFLFLISRQKKLLFLCFGLSFIVMFFIITPWLIRNHAVLDKTVFIQKSGEVFWRGNNPNATGSSYTADGHPMIESLSKGLRERIYNSTEIGQDRLFWDEGFSFIKHDPTRFLKLTVKKFYYFWWFSPQCGIEYPRSYLLIYKGLYAIILFFAALGVFFVYTSKETRIREGVFLLLLLFITMSLSQSFFYVEGRHRWMIEPLILIFTANGFINLINKVRRC